MSKAAAAQLLGTSPLDGPAEPWSEERVEVMTRMWREGHPASAIVLALGGEVTRNSVLGKIHRMGIARDVVPAPRATPTPKPQARAKPRATAKRAVVPSAPPVAKLTPVRVPPPGGVAFMDTRMFDCRYVISGSGMDSMCCGAQSERGSYCAIHAAMIYAGRAQIPQKILDSAARGSRRP